MIALFIKSGRGWFWELLPWFLIVELPPGDQQLVLHTHDLYQHAAGGSLQLIGCP